MKKKLSISASICSILLGALSCYVCFILYIALAILTSFKDCTIIEKVNRIIMIVMVLISLLIFIFGILCTIKSNKKRLNIALLVLLITLSILCFIEILLEKATDSFNSIILLQTVSFIPISLEIAALSIKEKEKINE